MDLVLSLETLATGESREIQSDLEMGHHQAMSGHSIKLNSVASHCPVLHVVSPKG